jgi:8-oxo-dGTP pyrophosphatase MutT (NUDIX family)
LLDVQGGTHQASNIAAAAAAAAAGFTIELCAGLVDKAKSLPQIVVEEIHEEVRQRISTCRQ